MVVDRQYCVLWNPNMAVSLGFSFVAAGTSETWTATLLKTCAVPLPGDSPQLVHGTNHYPHVQNNETCWWLHLAAITHWQDQPAEQPNIRPVFRNTSYSWGCICYYRRVNASFSLSLMIYPFFFASIYNLTSYSLWNAFAWIWDVEIIMNNEIKGLKRQKQSHICSTTSPWCWPYPQCTGLPWYTPWRWSRPGPTLWPVRFQKPPGRRRRWCCTAGTWSGGWWDTRHMRVQTLHIAVISAVLCVCTPPPSCDCKSLL